MWDARNPIRSVGSGDAEASTSDKNVTPPFTFNKKDLSTFHCKLHKYPDGEEVPNGSLALVAYTLGSYERDGVTILTPNLNWVVVIAADD